MAKETENKWVYPYKRNRGTPSFAEIWEEINEPDKEVKVFDSKLSIIIVKSGA
jgi:hypothetical protein